MISRGLTIEYFFWILHSSHFLFWPPCLKSLWLKQTFFFFVRITFYFNYFNKKILITYNLNRFVFLTVFLEVSTCIIFFLFFSALLLAVVSRNFVSFDASGFFAYTTTQTKKNVYIYIVFFFRFYFDLISMLFQKLIFPDFLFNLKSVCLG